MATACIGSSQSRNAQARREPNISEGCQNKTGFIEPHFNLADLRRGRNHDCPGIFPFLTRGICCLPLDGVRRGGFP